MGPSKVKEKSNKPLTITTTTIIIMLLIIIIKRQQDEVSMAIVS